MKVHIILNFILLLLIAGCDSNSTADTNETIDPAFTVGLQTDIALEISGEPREYHLFLPATPATASMVVLLHGNRGSSDQLLGLNRLVAPNKIWMDIALRENLILIVPNGALGPEGHQGWNDCRTDAVGNPDTDDVLFISTTIDVVANQYNVSNPNVFAVGISNGGIMSMRLADEMSEKLNAFAAVVASRPVNTECIDSAVAISALFMNGTQDPILPYDGGQIKSDRGELYSTIDAVAYWVNRNQANTANLPENLLDLNTQDNSSITVYSYTDGMNNTHVKHYEVIGGGHTEPSIQEQYKPLFKLVVGEQNNDIELAEEIWDFFDKL